MHLEKKGESLVIDGIDKGEVGFVEMSEKLFVIINCLEACAIRAFLLGRGSEIFK